MNCEPPTPSPPANVLVAVVEVATKYGANNAPLDERPPTLRVPAVSVPERLRSVPVSAPESVPPASGR